MAWQFQWDNRNFAVESDVVLHFVERFVLPTKKGAVRCKDLLDAQGERFTLYNVWCVPDNGTDAAANATLALRHFYREEVSKAMRVHNEDAGLLPRCPLPQSSPAWNYYHALVSENADAAERAKRATSYSPNTVKEEDRLANRIPHRLVVTHKDNLFDCKIPPRAPNCTTWRKIRFPDQRRLYRRSEQD